MMSPDDPRTPPVTGHRLSKKNKPFIVNSEVARDESRS